MNAVVVDILKVSLWNAINEPLSLMHLGLKQEIRIWISNGHRFIYG